MKDKKILKIAAFFIMIFLFMASAAQAVVNINTDDENTGNNDPDVSSTGDNYVWEDNFNNAQKIQLELSENFIVESGKVKMIDTYTQWDDPDWERMKIISLSSSVSGEVAVKLEVDYDTDMRADYGDIRFKFENDDSWLDYWIEEKNPDPSDPYAIFWVKVENLPSGSSTMYMFYCNDDPNIEDESDYWAVFDEDSWEKQFNVDERVTNHWYKEGAWDPDACYGEHDNTDVFLITWEEGTAYWPEQFTIFAQQIRGRYYDMDGNPECDRFDIVDEPANPPAYGYRFENPSGRYGKQDKFLVAYNEYTDWTWVPPAHFNNIDIEGAIVDNPVDGASSRFTICTGGGEGGIQADPCVAWNDNDDEFLVVWEDGRSGTNNYDIYGQRYNYNGGAVGSEIEICVQPNIQCEPWVTYDPVNEHYLCVWEESSDDPETGPFEIWGQLLFNNGNPLGGEFQISDSGTSSTDYNFPCCEFCELSERFLVTWQEDDISDNDWTGDIWGQILDENGDVAVDTFKIANGEFCRTDVVPYLTTSFFVSYDNWNPSPSGDIWGKMVNDTGSVNEYALQLSDSNTEACDWANIASDGDRIFVTWEDIRVVYQGDFDDWAPDPYFNIWSLNIPTSSQVTYSFSDEISMILDAHIVSKEIEPANIVEWVVFDAVKTDDVDFDLLDGETLDVLIEDMSPGANLDGITADNIRLKARFQRDDPSTTPTLDYWKVEYIGQDTEPPLTQVKEIDGMKGLRDIYVSNGIIVWLMAQDFPEDTGTGVEYTYYTINSEPQEIYNEDSGIQLSVDSSDDYLGEFTIHFWSVDKAGNVESPPKSEFVKIDAERPFAELTEPKDGSNVEIPFWIKANCNDNDRIDYVTFNIEPYEKRPDIPVQYPGPYEWLCDVDYIPPGARAKTHQLLGEDPPEPPQPATVSVHIRVKAYDMSGQEWQNEFFIKVTNWDEDPDSHSRIVEKVIVNNRPVIGRLNLGFAFNQKLEIDIPTPSNAEFVQFEAKNILTGTITNIIDIDLSDGCSASFDVPTGLYKITTTAYKENEEIAKEVSARVIYIHK